MRSAEQATTVVHVGLRRGGRSWFWGWRRGRGGGLGSLGLLLGVSLNGFQASFERVDALHQLLDQIAVASGRGSASHCEGSSKSGDDSQFLQEEPSGETILLKVPTFERFWCKYANFQTDRSALLPLERDADR